MRKTLVLLLLSLAIAFSLFTKPATTQTTIHPNQIRAGTFASGAFTFPGSLTVNGAFKGANVTQFQLAQASGVWIDVTASPYGAVGDGATDNGAAIQTAFNAVPTGVGAGAKIFFPCGTFRIKAAYIQWPVSTPIEMFGAGPCSVIQKDSDSTTQAGSPTGLFYSPQVYGQSTTLSANANRGDQQLSVTSSTGFVAGGWIQINDNTGFTGFNCTTYQTWEPSIASCNLELQQIDSVAAGVINLKTSLDNNYTTAGAATVKAITPVYAKVHDLKFSAAGPDCSIANACGGRFFDLSMAIESEFHHNVFDVPLAVAVQVHRGKHYKVFDNIFRNGDNTQTQSGLLAVPFLADEGSQYFTFSNNSVYKIGQVAIDSQSNHGEVIGNTLQGCGDDCINTHGHLDHDIDIKGNVMGGWPSSSASATVTGRCIIISDTDFNIQIEGNTCSTFSTKGIQVESASQGGIFNVQVLGNTVINPVTSTGTFPPNYLASTASGIIGISAVRCDNCKVNNNTIYGSFPTASTGLNLLGLRQSEAIGNHVIQTNTTPPTGDTGLFLESLSVGNVAHVIIAQNVVTGWHNANCETFNSSGTLDTVTFANNSCFGGPGTNYNYASLPTNLIRDNNEGDTNAFNSVVSTYNGITTAGQGFPVIQGATSQKAETGAADTNVLTVTPASTIGNYRACVAVSVSSATSGVISWTLSWTDSNGNAQSNIAQSLFQDGTAVPATTFTTSAAGNYHFCREFDVNNAGATIVVKWVGGGTTAAKMSATVERVI